MSATRYIVQKLVAIEAIAAGRFVEASTIIRELLEEQPIRPRPGQCRYCACTEARGCGIVVDAGHEYMPAVVRCGWADDDRTVCTSLSCLERWRQDSPAELDVDVHDVVQAHASRIVRP